MILMSACNKKMCRSKVFDRSRSLSFSKSKSAQFTAAMPFLIVLFIFVVLSVVGIVIAILFAPNGTENDKIVSKVNQQSFVLEMLKINSPGISTVDVINDDKSVYSETGQPYATLSKVLFFYDKTGVSLQRYDYDGMLLDTINPSAEYKDEFVSTVELPNTLVSIRLKFNPSLAISMGDAANSLLS